ncbi:unnamed protein product [Calypogeia fissa]
MSSSRAGAGAGSAAIPANARKTVQSLKEIVPNGEDEIYTVLKECNMDPNETVQRLLNQDPFHEVKRKRDKKKEWNKAGTDSKVRPASGGTQTRGGRGGMLERGSGRGGSLSRHSLNDSGGGRAKSSVPRENGGVNTSSRVSSASGGSSVSVAPSYGQGKSFISGPSHPGPTATVGPSAGVQNGSPSFMRPAPVAQGSWSALAPGHTTMADIVKANGAPLQPTGLTTPPATNSSAAPVSTSASQQYINAGTSSTPVSSGVYSSSTDPVLHPSLDARATGTSGAIKREIGTVGNQRTKGDWSSSSLPMDSLSAQSITSSSLQTPETSTSSPVVVVGPDRDTKATRPSSPSVSVSSPILQDRPASHPIADTNSSVGAQPRHGIVTSSSGLPGPRAPVVGGPFSRPVYLSQQHPVGTQKATGAGLEWKPKVVLQSPGSLGAVNTPSLSEAVRPSSPSSVSGDSGLVTAATSKMKAVSIHDDQPVIIPNHLQVAESEQTHLSFGSFAAGFGTTFPGSFVSEDSSKATISIAESTAVIDAAVEPSTSSSSANPVSAGLSQSYVHQSISAPEEALAVSNETSAVSLPAPTALQSDLPKLDPLAHQVPHYPYLPAIPNYGGFNVMQQVPVGQYTYEPSETQPPDATRLPSLVPYPDPTPSFYTPIYRPGSDGDGRYPFVTTNASNKYNGNMGLVNLTGQNLPSQEGGNSVLPPVPTAQTSQAGNGQTVAPVPQQPLPLHAYTGQPAGTFGHMQSGNSVLPPVPAAQTSQTGNGQTVAPVPQQPLPLHAYTGQPGGAPLGHHFANVFGYQYIQPSYAYMHSHPPYQHNYTTNSVYPQAPTGSSYPTAAASTYPPGGATAVKYPLPQYKPGSATGIGPPSAAATGYGGYSSAPSGYAANPSVTVGSTTGYDDVGVPQYKDSIYIQSQQEGSTVWIQAPLSRDMAVGGMQASSYYNIPGQGQHGTYAHAQQPSHGHTHPGAYGSLYHPPQSGQAPTTHQLLQQPPALGTGGGSQTGGYQQQQRTQQTWTNNY